MENQIIDVIKYTELPERSLPVIVSEIKTIEAQVFKTTLDGVIEIGKRLVEAKEQVGHGEWEEWCEKNLNYTSRQARKYIEISSKYGDENSVFSNRNTCSDLSISKAYSLLKVPEEELETFIEKVDVDSISVKELEAEIRQLKEEKDRLARSKEEAAEQQINAETTLRKRITELESDLENHKAGDPAALEAKEKEIQSLKDKLEKEKEKLNKEKEKLKTSESDKEKQIEEAVSKAIEKAKKEALAEAEAGNRAMKTKFEEAQETIAKLERNLANNQNKEIAGFKVKSDMLQESFNSCLQSITTVASEDPEKADKMKVALKTIMEQLLSKV